MCLPFSILLVPLLFKLTNSPPVIIIPLELGKNDIALPVCKSVREWCEAAVEAHDHDFNMLSLRESEFSWQLTRCRSGLLLFLYNLDPIPEQQVEHNLLGRLGRRWVSRTRPVNGCYGHKHASQSHNVTSVNWLAWA